MIAKKGQSYEAITLLLEQSANLIISILRVTSNNRNPKKKHEIKCGFTSPSRTY